MIAYKHYIESFKPQNEFDKIEHDICLFDDLVCLVTDWRCGLYGDTLEVSCTFFDDSYRVRFIAWMENNNIYQFCSIQRDSTKALRFVISRSELDLFLGL